MILFVCTGVILDQVIKAVKVLSEDNLKIGLFVATSPDKLYQDWLESSKNSEHISHLEKNIKYKKTYL